MHHHLALSHQARTLLVPLTLREEHAEHEPNWESKYMLPRTLLMPLTLLVEHAEREPTRESKYMLPSQECIGRYWQKSTGE